VVALATAALSTALPAGAQAAVMPFGSDLSLPATLNTVTSVPPPNHFGADSALWNTTVAGASAAAPAAGQIVLVRVKGCAQAAAGATTTSTEIHFQDLIPQPDGSLEVSVTTQAFNLPICGAGVDENTVTAFAPTNFCVHQGDYVDFNDNGGFDPTFYPHGVPLLVLGSRTGSNLESFIRHNGTGNGSTFSPSDVTANDGFGTSPNEELLLQAVLATGPDATPLCPGGTLGTPAPPTIVAAPSSTAVTTGGATFTASINPHGLTSSVQFEYAADLGFGVIAQAFTDYTHSTAEAMVGADYTDHTVTTTVSGLLPNATYHWRAVAANHLGTVTSADQTFKTPAGPPPPPPVLGKTVDIQTVSGVVFIKPPPGMALTARGTIARTSPPTKGQGFIPLTEARSIPVGSILDTTRGVALLTAATSSRAHDYTGDFTVGVFQLLQNRRQKGLTQLNIRDTVSRNKVCASVGKGSRAGAAKTVSSTVLGLLRSNVRGHFSTRGDYSAATVRGTEWTVTDTCAGTLTTVTRGAVIVDDFRRHKSILVGAGHSYLARAPLSIGKTSL
jgi:hypothetical protein